MNSEKSSLAPSYQTWLQRRCSRAAPGPPPAGGGGGGGGGGGAGAGAGAGAPVLGERHRNVHIATKFPPHVGTGGDGGEQEAGEEEEM